MQFAQKWISNSLEDRNNIQICIVGLNNWEENNGIDSIDKCNNCAIGI